MPIYGGCGYAQQGSPASSLESSSLSSHGSPNELDLTQVTSHKDLDMITPPALVGYINPYLTTSPQRFEYLESLDLITPPSHKDLDFVTPPSHKDLDLITPPALVGYINPYLTTSPQRFEYLESLDLITPPRHMDLDLVTHPSHKDLDLITPPLVRYINPQVARRPLEVHPQELRPSGQTLEDIISLI
jgi:hypothetical protein